MTNNQPAFGVGWSSAVVSTCMCGSSGLPEGPLGISGRLSLSETHAHSEICSVTGIQMVLRHTLAEKASDPATLHFVITFQPAYSE